VTAFAACSQFIAKRIQDSYKRDSTVIYPPVELGRFRANAVREDFYLTVSRLVPYKRVDLMVQACTYLKRPLKVVGTGPELDALKRVAGPTVEFLGWRTDEEIAELMGKARAFLFGALEDFGIVVIEAQAAGCPVIALGDGGTAETIIDLQAAQSLQKTPTGVHFQRQTVHSVIDAVQHFEENSALFSPESCRANAERFSAIAFREQFRTFADKSLAI
jgi:glycosyltransferase involved in cell wall biosynthesis